MWSGLFTLKADKEKKKRIQAVNYEEGILHNIESKLEELKDHQPSEDAGKMKDNITDVKEKLANKDSMDPEEIKHDCKHNLVLIVCESVVVNGIFFCKLQVRTEENFQQVQAKILMKLLQETQVRRA